MILDLSIEEIFNEVKINEYITPTSIWKIFNLGYGNVSNNIYSSFDVENVMKRFDVNRDCKVDIDEFRTIMEFGKEEETENNVIEYNLNGLNGSEDIISSNRKSRNTLNEQSNSMYNNYTKNSKKSNHTISNSRHNDIVSEIHLGDKENKKYYDTAYANKEVHSPKEWDERVVQYTKENILKVLVF